jgi:hypothetical protein
MFERLKAHSVTCMIGFGAIAMGSLLAAPAAEAHGSVQWSIGIQLPPVGAVVTSRPYIPPPPAVIYAPPPAVVYAPAYPVYLPPPRVVVAPAYGWAPPPGRRWKDRDRDGIPDRWERHPGWGPGHPHGPPPGYYRGW